MKRYFITIMMLVVTAALSATATGAQEKRQKPIVPKEKMVLWNGKDFTGWKLFVPNPGHDVTKTWSIKDGVIRCTGRPAGYMSSMRYPFTGLDVILKKSFGPISALGPRFEPSPCLSVTAC